MTIVAFCLVIPKRMRLSGTDLDFLGSHDVDH